MDDERAGAVWLASYPKSGNTWLRCLLEAYRRNGKLDINDIRISSSDGGATIMQGVSPIPLGQLGFNGEMLLRPAALLNLLARLNRPTWVKTHFANIQPDGLPHCIPKELTEKAVYVVRDPRSVALSVSRFFKFSMEMTVETLRRKDFTIGGDERFSLCLVSSWSNHAASWAGEDKFPLHVVKYEDLVGDAGKELTETLEFLGEEVDSDLVDRAVKATEIEKLRQTEETDGFRENVGAEKGLFFANGGTRWQDELGPKWIAQIEKDHGKVMEMLGYL